MPAPWIVAKACKAEEQLSDAESLLIGTRIDVVAARGDDQNPVADDAIRRLRDLADELNVLRQRLAPIVRDVAALIEDDDSDRDRRRRD